MIHDFQQAPGGLRDTFLHIQSVREALMMHLRHGDREFRGEFQVIEGIQDLKDVRDDGGPTGCSEYGQHFLSVVSSIGETHRGAHRGEWALARFDGIGFPLNQTKQVGDPRTRSEIIHFIVQQETRTGDEDFRSE